MTIEQFERTKQRMESLGYDISDSRILVIKAKGKTRRIKISGRRTKVYIKGALDHRGNLKVGMSCEITHPENGNEAKKVACP